VTARQPFLGKLEWIQKDVEKSEGIDSEAADEAKPQGVAEK
jgi:hypothetical protein